ncbi:MAG TPA: outer membrane beta-barrel protein [Methylomirabilota bacterium]|jgi:opacity protein-like surface antigen|nr:outer membrane beta-barrel protein [Methylomirabilota bacterium]
MTAQTIAASGLESAAVVDATSPGWYRRAGEGPFSLRDPLGGLYFLIGGHAGFAESTRLRDENGCDRPQAFFLGCDNTPPTDALGTGGGGSIGIGTRLTPALRAALIGTGEGGYRFRNGTPWLDRASGETFVEEFSLHSYQLTTNAYLDIAGLFQPGALGPWNPYVMTGAGVAFNVTGTIHETDVIPGVGSVVNTYPGSTRTSFLWTAGAGVQYLIVSGVIADLSYQYVDAGRFRAADGMPQINGLTGTPFSPPFGAIRGDLRTHRVGFAVDIEFDAIRRLFSGR